MLIIFSNIIFLLHYQTSINQKWSPYQKCIRIFSFWKIYQIISNKCSIKIRRITKLSKLFYLFKLIQNWNIYATKTNNQNSSSIEFELQKKTWTRLFNAYSSDMQAPSLATRCVEKNNSDKGENCGKQRAAQYGDLWFGSSHVGIDSKIHWKGSWWKRKVW